MQLEVYSYDKKGIKKGFMLNEMLTIIGKSTKLSQSIVKILLRISYNINQRS